MFVKICGITRAVDAEVAVEAGANALGFVFWPNSPRFVDPYSARAIAGTLPPFVVPVGVFVNQPVEYVKGVAALVGLGAVQLHGDEDAAYLARVRQPVIKAVSVSDASDQLDQWSPRTDGPSTGRPPRPSPSGGAVCWRAGSRRTTSPRRSRSFNHTVLMCRRGSSDRLA
jgi:phosphoribosylanthranilate isomerase